MGGGPGASSEGLDAARLRAEVRRRLDEVLGAGARVGVGVSGGPDSAGLALLVADARPDLSLHLLHVRHGLRDDAPDLAAATALGRGLGLPCSVAAVRVGAGAGPEAAARAARLAAFRSLAGEHGLAAVLLGHTAEDQAETVLLNLVRGAGLAGLAGMRLAREVEGLLLVRPLLGLRRADVRAVPRRAGVPVAHDPTNDDQAQRRARVRREVLPALARLAGGPGDPVAALTRTAALAAADEDLLAAQAQRAGAGLVAQLGPARLLRWEALAALPAALARRLVHAELAGLVGARPPAADVEAVRGLAAGGSATVGGPVRASRSQGWLVLRPAQDVAVAQRALPAGPVELPLVELGLVLRSHPAAAPVAGAPAGGAPAGGPPRAPEPDDPGPAMRGRWAPGPRALRLPAAPAGWSVAGLRPGERIAAGGRGRPLREVLRERGVPAAVRDLLPVLRDAHGAPAWVPGVVVADGSRREEGPGWGAWVLEVHATGGAEPLG